MKTCPELRRVRVSPAATSPAPLYPDSRKDLPAQKSITPSLSDPYALLPQKQKTLSFVFIHLHTLPPRRFSSSLCFSITSTLFVKSQGWAFRENCESRTAPVTSHKLAPNLEGSPLTPHAARLTGHAPLSPFPASHPKDALLTSIIAALTKSGARKSFPCRTYKNNPGGTPAVSPVGSQRPSRTSSKSSANISCLSHTLLRHPGHPCCPRAPIRSEPSSFRPAMPYLANSSRLTGPRSSDLRPSDPRVSGYSAPRPTCAINSPAVKHGVQRFGASDLPGEVIERTYSAAGTASAAGLESVDSAKPRESNVAAQPPLEDASRFCPVCSQRLESRRCKLICNVCGYYMSCADYY